MTFGDQHPFQLLTLNGTGRSLSADWVGRVLYWLEETSDGRYAIMKYDLYENNGKAEVMMSLTRPPGMMAVAPLSRYHHQILFSKLCLTIRNSVMQSNILPQFGGEPECRLL